MELSLGDRIFLRVMSLLRLLLGAVEGMALAHRTDPRRRLPPPTSPARATGAEQTPTDQSDAGDGADEEELPPPRNFTLFMARGDDDDPDAALYSFSGRVPPSVVAKPPDEYLREVVSEVEQVASRAEREARAAAEDEG